MMTDEQTVIDLVRKHGEAWLADILASALEIRADGYVGPEWRAERLKHLAKLAGQLKGRIVAEDNAEESR